MTRLELPHRNKGAAREMQKQCATAQTPEKSATLGRGGKKDEAIRNKPVNCCRDALTVRLYERHTSYSRNGALITKKITAPFHP
jgi:hypothetical protein